MEAYMPDRPLTRDTREAPTATDSAVLIGIVLVAAIALLFLFGANMVGEESTDVNTTQPNVQTPATGENKTP
jgi:hypothetical protein